jgi:phenylpyruvate tautomerase PptA (4-oxalocrotonate tautomerase family)
MAPLTSSKRSSAQIQDSSTTTEFTMPLVRISVPSSTTTQDIQSVSESVHRALVKYCNVPVADRFHLVQRHASDELICSPEFLNVRHSDHVVMVQIFFSVGRSLDAKKALYAEVASEIAAATSFATADVIINVSETTRENWSFGNGLAQYAL